MDIISWIIEDPTKWNIKKRNMIPELRQTTKDNVMIQALFYESFRYNIILLVIIDYLELFMFYLLSYSNSILI